MSVLLSDFDEFFRRNFQRFENHLPDRFFGYAYFRTYPEENIVIVCELPGTVRSALLPDSKIGPTVRVYLKIFKGEVLFDLIDTKIQRGWDDMLWKKIKALESFIDDEVKLCPDCNVFIIPRRSVTREGTKIIWPQCPNCKRRFSTTYGRGIKTLLHGFLK